MADLSLIKAMANDSSVIDKIKSAGITQDLLKSEIERYFFNVLLDFNEKDWEITEDSLDKFVSADPTLNKVRKQNFANFIPQLFDEGTTTPNFTIGQLQEYKRKKEMLDLLVRTTDLLSANDIEAAQKLLNEKVRSFIDISTGYEVYDYTSEEAYEERHAKRAEVEQGVVDGITFDKHMSYLSKYLPRGLESATITTINGLTGRGKSLFMANMVRAAIDVGNEKSGIYFVGENKYIQAATRLDAIVLDVPYVDMYRDTIVNDRGGQAFFKNYKGGRVKIVKFTPFSNFNTDIMEQIINEFIEENGEIGWIACDSPDHMKSTVRYAEHWRNKGGVYEDLKRVADMYKVPIIATVPNKQSVSKRDGLPMAEDTANSADIGRIVDNQIHILQDQDDMELGRRRIAFGKLRDGENDSKMIALALTPSLRFELFDEYYHSAGGAPIDQLLSSKTKDGLVQIRRKDEVADTDEETTPF